MAVKFSSFILADDGDDLLQFLYINIMLVFIFFLQIEKYFFVISTEENFTFLLR